MSYRPRQRVLARPGVRSVIVHGPMACGKTRNAERIRAYLGCDCVVDDWDGREKLPPNSLALTNWIGAEQKGALSLSFHDVMRFVGDAS